MVEGGSCIRGPAFLSLVVEFLGGNETVRKKRDFCADRASADRIIDTFPLEIFLFMSRPWCELPFSLCLVLSMDV